MSPRLSMVFLWAAATVCLANVHRVAVATPTPHLELVCTNFADCLRRRGLPAPPP